MPILIKIPEKIWVEHTEKTLCKKFLSGEFPFIGLYSDLFSDKSREKLHQALCSAKDPFDECLYGLQKWPATFVSYLTIYVKEWYGTKGTAEVWPFVSQAIFSSKRELTNNEQEKLWQAYRRACIQLGLDVVPKDSFVNYRVAEFLHKAGVPEAFLPQLAENMLRHANVVGIPEDDDPQGITLWQTSLLDDHLQLSFSKIAMRAIKADCDGYYTRSFLRVLAGKSLDSTSCFKLHM